MPDNQDILNIRADASTEVGIGHVMRCLALAQAWMDEGVLEWFICAELPKKIEERLRRESCEVFRIEAPSGGNEDIEQTLAALGTDQTGTWLVIDGYAFERNYQHAMREAGYRVLLIDDYNHLPEYECDILLNQNIGAEEYEYKVNAGARLLLGPGYALLRREFQKVVASNDWKKKVEEHPTFGRNILVTMGGADPYRMTEKIVATLINTDTPLHIKAVIGAAYPSKETLLSISSTTRHHCEILFNVEDMPTLMQWADIAVSAAGSTCWELVAMGVPMVLFILAENQARIAKCLHEQGVAVNLGWYDNWSLSGFSQEFETLCHAAHKRLHMRQAGMKLLDGEGPFRVISHMQAHHLILRRVTMADAELLLAWANDPQTKAMSFSSGRIDIETHRNWLAQRLSNAENMLFIAQDRNDNPLGHVRLELDHGGNYVISINMAPTARGGGNASRIISLALKEVNTARPDAAVFALIKPANLKSVRAFKGVGFRHQGREKVCEEDAISMVWEPLDPL